jgi:hypothetical protein
VYTSNEKPWRYWLEDSEISTSIKMPNEKGKMMYKPLALSAKPPVWPSEFSVVIKWLTSLVSTKPPKGNFTSYFFTIITLNCKYKRALFPHNNKRIFLRFKQTASFSYIIAGKYLSLLKSLQEHEQEIVTWCQVLTRGGWINSWKPHIYSSNLTYGWACCHSENISLGL